jgi:general secretion pathway protein D
MAAGAAWLSVCFVAATAAEPGRLNRGDVDELLNGARAAIEAGDFARAGALVDQAEAAHPKYSLFHLGPTPALVRRELTKAEKAAGKQSASPSALGRGTASYQPAPVGQPTDPFAARMMNAPTTMTPAGDVRQASATSTQGGSAPVVPALHSMSVGEPEAYADPAASVEIEQYGSQSAGASRISSYPATSNPSPYSPGAGAGSADPKSRAVKLLRDARAALAAGDIEQAEESVRLATAVGVPESTFLPNEDRPSLLAWEIQQARANGQSPRTAAGTEGSRYAAQAALESRSMSSTSSPQPLPPLDSDTRFAALPEPMDLPPESGDGPLSAPSSSASPRSASNRYAAVNAPAALPATPQTAGRMSGSTLLDTAAADEQAKARQLSAEVGKKQSEARRLRETKPQAALQLLQETRAQVADSNLSEEYRSQLLRRVDITLDETEKYIKEHHAEIEFDEKNEAVQEEVERRREVKLKVQDKIAQHVDDFNRLRDEQRYAEMEVVARRLFELAPDDPVARQVWENSKFIRRTVMNRDVADAREIANWQAWHEVEAAGIINVGDAHPLVYDQKIWDDLVKDRKSAERETRRTERELEIERRLKTPVLLRYQDTPLSEVIGGLSELAGINIHLDPRGLSQEGVESSTLVTVNLSKEISLKSALNLILEPLHLSYVIKDEVLKITSEQLRDGETYSKVYNVADLVIPIPNFVPNNNIGLQGLINDAHQTLGYGAGGFGAPGPAVLVNGRGAANDPTNSSVLAQQFGGGGMGGASGPSSMPIGSGPGGLGGAASADFDSLIDLIVSTVATETWAENGGGEAEIRPFPTNLSLVISQTQAVHEEIADLLEQLRRLQDLQVTIEVRFIQLNDSFFERIGVDFDANIGPPASANTINADGTYNRSAPSAVVGARPAVIGDLPVFTADLEVPFRQGSFSATAPAGFDANQAANFGFAILSDIEAYFLIEAVQSDRRTNVLNAPKVTLFNGQQAFVADAVSQPFVIGVIPVVGEFASALQPVIVVLNEGTMMTIQAVVSNDRRYVRLTVVPFFTQVGEVDTFTFEGSTSTTSSSENSDDDEDGNDESSSDSESEATTGVTVQLPAFQFISVVTTVSVPDGGTVLLGGIKRLSEGRSEVGVPLLSKVPYVNRLFRNVGIDRSTDSLMMMVTPRIIIQEEEEERLGFTSADQGTY